MNRREFVAGLGAAGAMLGAKPGRGQQRKAGEGGAGEFPADAYTPYGYLNNPFHGWDLHRSGVIRSVEAMGFGFYFPAGPGGYFDYQDTAIYQALLRVGVAIGGKAYFDRGDFGAGELTAPYHSHNLFTYGFEAGGVGVEASFVQVGEDTLAAQVRVRNRGAGRQRATVMAAHEYHLGAERWWGRDGLTGAVEKGGGALTTRGFAAGTVFRLQSSQAEAEGLVATGAGVAREFLLGGKGAAEAVSYYPAALYAALRGEVELEPGEEKEIGFWLTRSANRPGARAAQRRARAATAEAVGAKREEDGRFWARAPRLGGDWPAHWRRGMVYDFETLRMNVRRPQGVYRHAWDGMQIQAPRNVLAETSIDMWALSYADAATAEEVLTGQFADAVEGNVPCMRESGVMNMVATDGEACGTSIAWCYPLFCMESVGRRSGRREWRGRLYARLAAFVRWTLEHRTDAGGYVVGKCSWETGMDASSRFLIQQPTGGELIDFIRVVELQAATAHAGRLLAGLAAEQRKTAEAAGWRKLEGEYTAKTQSLWNGRDWFQDFDTRTGKAIVLKNPATGPLKREVGQCAPIFLGVATAEQMRAMAPLLRQYRARPNYFLEWPSFVLPYLESLWMAGERAFAAEVVRDIAERVYGSMDRREVGGEGLGWPGVSCEMWALKGALGGEGYGWGATLPAHIIRSVIGFREAAEAGRVSLCPNLPEALAVEGKSYTVENLGIEGERLSLRYTVGAGGAVQVEGRWAQSGRRLARTVANHTALELAVGGD